MRPLKSGFTGNSYANAFSAVKSAINSDIALRQMQIKLSARQAQSVGSDIRMHENGVVSSVFKDLKLHDIVVQDGPLMRFRTDGILDRIQFSPRTLHKDIARTWIDSGASIKCAPAVANVYNARQKRAQQGNFKNYGQLRALTGLVEPEAEIGALLSAIREPVAQALVSILEKDILGGRKGKTGSSLTFAQVIEHLYGSLFIDVNDPMVSGVSLENTLNGYCKGLGIFGLKAEEIGGSLGSDSRMRGVHVKGSEESLKGEGIVYIRTGLERTAGLGLVKSVLGLGSSGIAMSGDGILASPLTEKGHIFVDMSMLFDMDTGRKKKFLPNVPYSQSKAPAALTPNLSHEMGHALQFIHWSPAQWETHRSLAELRCLDVAETPAVFGEFVALLPNECCPFNTGANSVSVEGKVRRAQRLLATWRFLLSADLDYRLNYCHNGNLTAAQIESETAAAIKASLPGVKEVPDVFNPLCLSWGHALGSSYGGAMQAYLFALVRAAPEILKTAKCVSDKKGFGSAASSLSKVICLNPFSEKSCGRNAEENKESPFAQPLANLLLKGGGVRALEPTNANTNKKSKKVSSNDSSHIKDLISVLEL